MKRNMIRLTSLLVMLVVIFSFTVSAFAYTETWPEIDASGNISMMGNYWNNGSTADTLSITLYRVTSNGDVLVGSNSVYLPANGFVRSDVPLAYNQPAGKYKAVLNANNYWSVVTYLKF